MIKLVLLNLCISFFGTTTNENIDTYLDQLHKDGQLNGNVLVIKDGETLYENSFGYSDGSKSTILTKDYRFNIGSVYKEFPAVAIMQLQEKGQLNLNDNISKYLSELPEWSDKVTIKQLLQYSSGLPKIGWNNYFGQGVNVTDDHILEEIKSTSALEFEPGTDYLYSNMNPVLLIKIVEHIAESTFKDYLQEHIFDPFGLTGTVIKGQYPYADKTLMAIPFNSDFEEDAYQMSVKSLLFNSTAHDMATWFEKLGDFKIINKESVKTLSEKAMAGDNIQAPLGFGNWVDDRITEHTHHGTTVNYECLIRRFKQDGITIVILTNQKHGNVHEISDTIYEMVKKDK